MIFTFLSLQFLSFWKVKTYRVVNPTATYCGSATVVVTITVEVTLVVVVIASITFVLVITVELTVLVDVTVAILIGVTLAVSIAHTVTATIVVAFKVAVTVAVTVPAQLRSLSLLQPRLLSPLKNFPSVIWTTTATVTATMKGCDRDRNRVSNEACNHEHDCGPSRYCHLPLLRLSDSKSRYNKCSTRTLLGLYPDSTRTLLKSPSRVRVDFS